MASYTFLMTGILLVIIAIVWSFLMVGLNPIVDIHNSYAKAGAVSVQSHALATWSIAFLLGLPGIGMIAIWIFIINRSVEISQAGSLW